MDRDTALGLLTVAELPRVGERRLRRIQAAARAADLPFARLPELPARRLAEIGVPEAALRRLATDRIWHTARCAALAQRLHAAGVRLCALGDRGYPRGWAHRATPPPPLVYLHGDIALLHRPTVALLSSRLVSGTTVTATLSVARAAAAAGFAIAVGGMKATHRIAAAAVHTLGAPRLVVVDRGLLSAFSGDLERDPFGFGPLRPPFDRRHTLALSPFRPEDHGLPCSGRRRDALIAALGDLVVAVQARPGGEIEGLCSNILARGGHVLVWQAENERLMAVGAQAVHADDAAAQFRALAAGLAGSPAQ
ncbi:MAG: DNA-processing protein DprA [Candidatus Binatia bacterium]